jgi:hypothetical protein
MPNRFHWAGGGHGERREGGMFAFWAPCARGSEASGWLRKSLNHGGHGEHGGRKRKKLNHGEQGKHCDV